MRWTGRFLLAGACLGAVVVWGVAPAQPAQTQATAASRPATGIPERRDAGTQPAPIPKPTGKLARIFAGGVPENADDVCAMERHIRLVSQKVLRATVGVRVGFASASGVIVSKDGYVLTAGHVVGSAGRDVTLFLSDGRRVRAKTFGANHDVDSGLIQITEKPGGDGDWPFCEMGESGSIKQGQWCLALGHPGGYQRGRSAPIRLGRVLRSTRDSILSDCTIVGGDSGGPLFDMEGKVIGISSRIGGPIEANLHVPMDVYRQDWDKLAKSEVWGGRSQRGGAYLGVVADEQSDRARITGVVPGSAAQTAGMKSGDVITHLDGRAVPNFQALVEMIAAKRPGDKVKITVLRDGKTLELQAVLGRRR